MLVDYTVRLDEFRQGLYTLTKRVRAFALAYVGRLSRRVSPRLALSSQL